ncbi:MAG: hypothetical protein JNM43_18415 [Planctomycetaceae bacterium]|nr:hypothetical protein [Planctomycetaceae bacterium]
MSSPFTFFRRNQHVWMVGIVILSMVAFTISDMMTQTSSHYVTLGILLGGGVFAFLGISQGRWIQYGIAGAVLGGLFGWLLPGAISSPTGFYQTSTIGAFDDKRIQELTRRRMIANLFMQQACARTETQPRPFGFAGNQVTELDLMFGEILRAEAKDMGIAVTNRMVTEYLHFLTQDKLTSAMFAEIRSGMNFGGEVVSEPELFDAFRQELEARLAYFQLTPNGTSLPQAPGVLYELFKRSRVNQRLNTVRLDVDAFLPEVEEPKDADVERLFAEYRLKFPNTDEPGSPGFRQPNKAKLAYLELGYKTVEASVTPPTDQEVEAYYNEKKDLLYRKEAEPETPEKAEGAAPATPESGAAPDPNAAPAAPTEGATPETPAPDAPKTEGAAPEAPKPEGTTPAPGAEVPKPEAPAPAAPEVQPGTTEPPKEAPAAPAETPAEAPKAGEECFPFAQEPQPTEPQPAAPAAPQATEQAAAAPTAAAPAETPAAQDAKPADPAAPAAPADQKPAEGQPAAAQPGDAAPLTIPAAGQNGETPEFIIPKVEYRPLDDELKAEIRDQLLDEKVRKALQEKMDKVMADLRSIEQSRSAARREIVTKEPDIAAKDLFERMQPFGKKMVDEMKKLAEKHGASFVETPLLSDLELYEGESYPIGGAVDISTRTPVVDDAFASFYSSREFDPYDDISLYSKRRAIKTSLDLDSEETQFAWWVIEFSPSHEPKLEDPGIRDQVVLALKRTKAREIAKKRAEDLAKVIKDGLAKPEGERKDMAATVEGQTLNGKPDSAALTLRRTQIFSWLEPSMNPQMDFFQQTPPRISQIQFSDDAGGSIRYAFDRFMKTVFEDIAANEVGVVPDDNLRSYYVVQPIDRNSNEEILRQQFLTEGKQFAFRFGTLANLVSAEIAAPANNAWELALWKKYGIDREAPPAE